MTDLSPDTDGKLSRLIPRLATDSDGEVLATVAAIRRTLDRAGMDLYDLAARLATDAPRPVRQAPHTPDPATLFEMAGWLHSRARNRLTAKQADFVASAARLLAAGRALTPKQTQWLRNLHAQFKGI